MELRINDEVDFTLSPVGSFTKGNYLKGKVIGFTLGKYIKIESPVYTKRSGLASICVQRNCVRPHAKANALRAEAEAKAKREEWLISMTKPRSKKKAKRSKKDHSKYTKLAN